MPWPTPTHMVAKPRFRPALLQRVQRRRRRGARRSCPADGRARWRRRAGSRARASSGRPSSRRHGQRLAAKASLSSIRSNSPSRQPQPPHQPLRRRHRADAHHPRLDPGGGHAQHARPRRQPVPSAPLREARIIAAAPSLTPDALPAVTVPPSRNGGLQLRQRLGRGVGARMLVALDRQRPCPCVCGSRPATISSAKKPAAWAAAGALLAAQGEGVLVARRDLEVLGDVLGRLGHRLDAVLRLHDRVHEAPADGGVEHLRRALEGASRPCP